MKVNTLAVNDENRNPKEQTTISVASETPMNDYHYGEKGDILANWLNTPADIPEAREKGRQAAAKMMAPVQETMPKTIWTRLPILRILPIL